METTQKITSPLARASEALTRAKRLRLEGRVHSALLLEIAAERYLLPLGYDTADNLLSLWEGSGEENPLEVWASEGIQIPSDKTPPLWRVLSTTINVNPPGHKGRG